MFLFLFPPCQHPPLLNHWTEVIQCPLASARSHDFYDHLSPVRSGEEKKSFSYSSMSRKNCGREEWSKVVARLSRTATISYERNEHLSSSIFIQVMVVYREIWSAFV